MIMFDRFVRVLLTQCTSSLLKLDGDRCSVFDLLVERLVVLQFRLLASITCWGKDELQWL